MDLSVKVKYKKMVRSYRRLAQISINNDKSISSTEAIDAAEEFFNQCYHLKDFIKKDKELIAIIDVEEFINDRPHLSLAADYCNTFKHKKLNKKPRLAKTIEKISTHIFDLRQTIPGLQNFTRLEIKIDGKSYDVFAIATECLKAWNQYLTIHGLELIIEKP